MSAIFKLRAVEEKSKYDFEDQLRRRGIDLPPLSIDTLQVNVTKLCNQVCRHCHVDAGPQRKEMLSPEGIARCLEILERHPQIAKLDITGGAPELHPGFDAFVEKAVALGKHVMVRHNLTVQLDGNPQTKESKEYLPQFFARNRVEVISSLPYYQEYFTDAQRGSGVFKKSMEAMRRLNARRLRRRGQRPAAEPGLQPGRPVPAGGAGGAGGGLQARAEGQVRAGVQQPVHDHQHADQPLQAAPGQVRAVRGVHGKAARGLQPGRRRGRDVPQPDQRRPRRPHLRLRLQPDARDGRGGREAAGG